MKSKKRDEVVMDSAHRAGLLKAPWRMLESDHEKVLSQIHQLRRLCARLIDRSGRRPTPRQQLREFLGLLETRNRAHFRVEEEIVFPFLTLHTPSLRNALNELTVEHSDMLRQSQLCIRLSKGSVVPMQRAGMRLAQTLECHLQKEMQLLNRIAPSVEM